MMIMFAALPRYLSQLLAGQEPTQLSQGSAAKVLEVMDKVQLLASHSLDLKKLYHHLSQNIASYLQPWSKKVRNDGSSWKEKKDRDRVGIQKTS